MVTAAAMANFPASIQRPKLRSIAPRRRPSNGDSRSAQLYRRRGGLAVSASPARL